MKLFVFQSSKRECLQVLSEQHGFTYEEKSSDNRCMKLNSNDTFACGEIAFKTFMDSYIFWRKNVECGDITFRNHWYERFNGEIATELLHNIQLTLNEDCIDEIAKYLDVVSFADLLLTCPSQRLKMIAAQWFANLIINQTTVGRQFGVLNLYYVLYVMGSMVENITVALDSFCYRVPGWNTLKMCSILYYICKLTGPNLRSVSLQNFSLNTNHPYNRSLIDELRLRNVVLNM